MKNQILEISGDSIFIKGFDPLPLQGYEKPDNFPFCCPAHQSYFDASLQWFTKFPNCCAKHKELKLHYGFNKANYAHLPMKVVTLISYTEYFIHNRHNEENWFKDITDYIEYCVSSFGHPNTGMFLYYSFLEQRVKIAENWSIPKRKRLKILDYLSLQFEEGVETPIPSLTVLHETYYKWLNTFPFEISYFKELKDRFQKTLPLLKTQPEFNPYTKMYKAKLTTQIELIEFLTKLTFELLNKISFSEISNQELLEITAEHSFNLIKESHRIKQKQLLNNYSNGEMQYVKVLNEWLTNEKEFFKEISLLPNSVAKPLPPANGIKPNVFCKSMPLNIPKDHFKVFVETNSKNNNKPFLTQDQLNSFIEKAFCGKIDLPKEKFNQAPKGEKLLIQTVFYEFYNSFCFEYFSTMQCQDIFIKLLTDNFEGWDFKNVKENFTPKTNKRL